MSYNVSPKSVTKGIVLGCTVRSEISRSGMGLGVRVCPGQENSRMAFKQSSFWWHIFWHKASDILNGTHKSLSQEQHRLLLDKDHPPTLSHLRVGECDHIKGQTAEKKNNLRFSRYLRDTRRSLLCHHATHYRGGSSVGTVVETRVQGYRCPQIPTVSLQRALQRDQGHLKQNRGQKSCSQQKF